MRIVHVVTFSRTISERSENQDSSNQAIPHQTFVIFLKKMPHLARTTQKLYVVVLR